MVFHAGKICNGLYYFEIRLIWAVLAKIRADHYVAKPELLQGDG